MGSVMAKEHKRSNRETKKPKQSKRDRDAAVPVTPGPERTAARIGIHDGAPAGSREPAGSRNVRR
jgi:hypothetical protein